MFDWAKQLDRWLFSPPHTLESVLRQIDAQIEEKLSRIGGRETSAELEDGISSPRPAGLVTEEGGRSERG